MWTPQTAARCRKHCPAPALTGPLHSNSESNSREIMEIYKLPTTQYQKNLILTKYKKYKANSWSINHKPSV